jgi:alpha-mannosidase
MMNRIRLGFTVAVMLLVVPLGGGAETFDRPWEIHLIHHTHLDIGYTHPQEEVIKKQWGYLDEALDLIDQTSGYPPEARFRWNPENNFAVEGWLAQASPEQKARFIRAAREGSIGLEGDFANMLWELCRPAELMQAMAGKYDLERITGVKVESAMLSDVPGMPWGLVTALAQNGVRYFSVGPNRGDRIGYVLKDWADKPFYWTSPSGRDRVLVFIHGKGYSWFHNGPQWDKLPILFTPKRVFGYLKDLEKSGYPYDIIPIRYNVGGDNGPPDPRIAAAVKAWNEQHPEVKVKLTTVSESFREFEARYGDKIPSFTGDFTPYWPDGAASTARETAMAREAAERLTQAQTLHALTPGAYPAADFRAAWTNVLLFNEHTWGAYNSIVSPDGDLAKTQWEWKRMRAVEAVREAGELLASIAGPADASNSVTVVNTNSFAVKSPAIIKAAGPAALETAAGKPIPAQALADGGLFFLAAIDGLSQQQFILKPGAPAPAAGQCSATPASIANGRLEIRWDNDTGAITSVKRLADGREFVNQSFRDQFNGYVYINGRRPALSRTRDKFSRTPRPQATITVKEQGPLTCAVEIKRPAPGSNSLTTAIVMYDGLDRIDLINTLDRPVVRRPEAIHFAFPVAAQNPKVRYDVAWGSVEVDQDQLPGSCKNFFTPSRWVDVSGDDGGLAIVLVDAPMFEAGAIANDAKRVGWLRETVHNGVVYSYAMNNYWHTNYKADQPGVTVFRFSLFPHDGYDPAANSRMGLSVMEPLIVTAGKHSGLKAPLTTGNDNIIIESILPSPLGPGLEIDLANLSDREQTAALAGAEKCRLLTNGRDLTPLPPNPVTFSKHDLMRLVCEGK